HAGEITRLLQNLLSNAMKYCEAEPRIKVCARRDGAFWELSVADNGIGVPDDKREAVFGLFERLHPWERYEGSGIGLAACRKVVERHGGRIWLEPTPGGGTTVKFTLPA
ncbi:MAG: GHKL domain-containing protein, partial [Elusimicrobia bacterium]|nr:GHKL domain-containing protein [Elusimicrobiota bacterium]